MQNVPCNLLKKICAECTLFYFVSCLQEIVVRCFFSFLNAFLGGHGHFKFQPNTSTKSIKPHHHALQDPSFQSQLPSSRSLTLFLVLSVLFGWDLGYGSFINGRRIDRKMIYIYGGGLLGGRTLCY